jgi:virulence-associated protein VagC
MLEGYARIILPSRSDRSKTGILYIPADVVKDSSFPFNSDQEVTVRIEGRRLVIEGVRIR